MAKIYRTFCPLFSGFSFTNTPISTLRFASYIFVYILEPLLVFAVHLRSLSSLSSSGCEIFQLYPSCCINALLEDERSIADRGCMLGIDGRGKLTGFSSRIELDKVCSSDVLRSASQQLKLFGVAFFPLLFSSFYSYHFLLQLFLHLSCAAILTFGGLEGHIDL